MSINKLVEQHTEYMDSMTTIISKQQGTIDKFIGDGIMYSTTIFHLLNRIRAFWNAPEYVENHFKKACVAACECQKRLWLIREEWKKKGSTHFSSCDNLMQCRYTILCQDWCSQWRMLCRQHGKSLINSSPFSTMCRAQLIGSTTL